MREHVTFRSGAILDFGLRISDLKKEAANHFLIERLGISTTI